MDVHAAIAFCVKVTDQEYQQAYADWEFESSVIKGPNPHLVKYMIFVSEKLKPLCTFEIYKWSTELIDGEYLWTVSFSKRWLKVWPLDSVVKAKDAAHGFFMPSILNGYNQEALDQCVTDLDYVVRKPEMKVGMDLDAAVDAVSTRYSVDPSQVTISIVNSNARFPRPSSTGAAPLLPQTSE
jgi:hypothetical protein